MLVLVRDIFNLILKRRFHPLRSLFPLASSPNSKSTTANEREFHNADDKAIEDQTASNLQRSANLYNKA